MTTIAYTKENNAKIVALTKVKETRWAGTTIHDNMDKCLRAICLFCGVNSGHYNPTAIKIKKVTGWFMVNQDGSIFCEARVIKEDANRYRIEYMSDEAWKEFENNLSKLI